MNRNNNCWDFPVWLIATTERKFIFYLLYCRTTCSTTPNQFCQMYGITPNKLAHHRVALYDCENYENSSRKLYNKQKFYNISSLSWIEQRLDHSRHEKYGHIHRHQNPCSQYNFIALLTIYIASYLPLLLSSPRIFFDRSLCCHSGLSKIYLCCV